MKTMPLQLSHPVNKSQFSQHVTWKVELQIPKLEKDLIEEEKNEKDDGDIGSRDFALGRNGVQEPLTNCGHILQSNAYVSVCKMRFEVEIGRKTWIGHGHGRYFHYGFSGAAKARLNIPYYSCCLSETALSRLYRLPDAFGAKARGHQLHPAMDTQRPWPFRSYGHTETMAIQRP
ncbi:hypothetical protein L596_000319 [Steinernema carpocapsae]|uniref:Uncharacterized protein n=1 Tax=Steinernema carpocapsae TaxID=34508 RepID=A0A4U8UJ71_STECR|nr:hypothetical protein L596_000319 [Steinernema carpocapsae]